MGTGAEITDRHLEEQWTLYRWRYDAARLAGLTMVEAQLFADSLVDIGELRRLAGLKCPPRLIVRLLL